MYSRKYIRPIPASAATLPTGGASPEYERPAPPPDYAGIAFRAPEGRRAEDFPETVIPPADTADAGFEESMTLPTNMPSESAVMRSDGDEEAVEVGAAEPSELDAGDTFYADEAEPPTPNENAMPDSEPPSEEDEGGSKSPLEWLRALKMEDLLLLWLLLMLLYGESNDEIELLLGLLLFAGR